MSGNARLSRFGFGHRWALVVGYKLIFINRLNEMSPPEFPARTLTGLWSRVSVNLRI